MSSFRGFAALAGHNYGMTVSAVGTRAPSRLGLALYAYAGGSLDAGRARRAAEAAGGLVVRRTGGIAVARQVRDHGWEGPLLADAALYEKTDNTLDDRGDGTLFGDRHETWASRQEELGVAAHLSPSCWVPAERPDVLEDVLEDGIQYCESLADRVAYVVLAVDRAWLARHADALTRAAASSGQRIALVIGDRYNPFDSVAVVEGLIHFLRRVPGTLLLRADVSVVGALAHGAAGGAYGSSSGVRHVWPPDAKNSRGGGPQGITTVLVASLLRHLDVDKLEHIPPDDGALDCWVPPCGGAPVRRFAQPRYEAEREIHDFHTVRALAEQALGNDPVSAAARWRAMCKSALNLHNALSPPKGVRLEPKPYLNAWVRACSDHAA